MPPTRSVAVLVTATPLEATDIVRNARSREVRKQALYQIGNEGDSPAAIKALGEIARDRADPELQIAAIQSLGNTGSDEAVPILAEIAKKGSTKHARSTAVNSLGQIGSEKAKAALLDIIGMKGKE